MRPNSQGRRVCRLADYLVLASHHPHRPDCPFYQFLPSATTPFYLHGSAVCAVHRLLAHTALFGHSSLDFDSFDGNLCTARYVHGGRD
ncbi:hypothetical protein Q1695_010756 [Nippostrongylus brasiliensis]|nr:hypothetical protein Q1695_010756 [Nippostrongylus brasiliensis]